MTLRNGIDAFARTLAEGIASAGRARAGAADVLDLGTILPDMSLKLDRFGKPIPKGQYLVCRALTLGDPMVKTRTTVVGDHGQHDHEVPVPEKLKPLGPGDRVLVAWVNSADPVVIDVVVSS